MDEVRDYGFLDLWDAVSEVVPDRECIVQGDRRLTWGEVRDRTTRLGWWLSCNGLGPRPGPVEAWESPNDLVGLFMRNCPEYLEASLSCYRSRCAPFNVNYRYKSAEVAQLLADARPACVIYQLEFGPVLAEALEMAGQSPLLVHVDDGSGIAPPTHSVSVERAIAEAHPPDEDVVPSPDDVHVLFTGGTTGLPKGVIWRLRELAGRTCGIQVTSLEQARDDAPRRGWLRAYPAPPLMHGAAAWFAYGAWSRGGTIVLDDRSRFDAATALRMMREEEVTWMAIVGDAFAQPIIQALRSGEPAPASLTYVFSSGAALSTSSWKELESHFPRLQVVNALGSSETGPQAFQTASGQQAFSAGPETCVVTEDYSQILSGDRPGTGWLANGGELPRGYLNRREATERVFRVIEGRRLSVSGDHAAVSSSGEITFLGRGTGVINTGGEKVHAEEVESVLLRHPDVDEALVFGRPSEQWGNEVAALLVARGPNHPESLDLRRACGDQLAGYKFPKVIVWVAHIKRHANGKPDYDWAEAALEQALRDAASVDGLRPVERR